MMFSPAWYGLMFYGVNEPSRTSPPATGTVHELAAAWTSHGDHAVPLDAAHPAIYAVVASPSLRSFRRGRSS